MTGRRVLELLRTPLTLILLVVIVVYGLWWGYSTVLKATAERPVPGCVTQSASAIVPAQINVRVYNGGATAGLAGKVATTLRAKGFTVSRVGNTEEHINATIIVGASADSPQVKLVLAYFEKATVRPDNRGDGSVDVLVGDAYDGMTATPPAFLDVPGGVICVTSSPSPSTSPSASSSRSGLTPSSLSPASAVATQTKR